MYQERQNQRAPPAVLTKYKERVEIVPYDDGWTGYEGVVLIFNKPKDCQWIGMFKVGWIWGVKWAYEVILFFKILESKIAL